MGKKIPKGRAGASFYVGSLLHTDPREYVGVFNAWTGELKGHVNLNSAPASEEIEEDYMEEPEMKDINQLSLF